MIAATGYERLNQIEKGLLALHGREGMDGDDQAVLLDAALIVAWDDAIHVAAPWEPRSALCGNWFRNLVTIDEPRPDGMEGCWTCLMTAEWIDNELAPAARVPWRCRLGWHAFPTWWPNIAPVSGGGPSQIDETCTRCGTVRLTKNRRA